MATKSPIAAIYTDLVTALSTIIDTKSIFTGGRPKNVNSETGMTKFIAVELPTNIEDIAAGSKRFVLDTTGVISLFTKAKTNGTLNINATSDFVDSVERLFPIVGEYCGAANPRILMSGADEYGYQFVTITFDIQTKANVFNQN